jgi:hypothetical protein
VADLPKEPSSNEPLARFLVQSGDFSREKNCLRPRAFNPKDKRTSVFRILNLSDDEIWQVGKEHVASPRKKPLYGRGDLTIDDVKASQLLLDPNDTPHRHADIVGWPDDPAAQLSLTQELARRSTLRLVDS